MIAAEPTPAHDPGDASLHHPSSGKRAKTRWEECVPVDRLSFGHQHPAFGYRESLDRLHGPAQVDFQPGDHMAGVMTITPQQLHPGKILFERQEQESGSFLIGALGSGDFDIQEAAPAIDQEVAFAPPDFFPPHHSPFQDHEPRWF